MLSKGVDQTKSSAIHLSPDDLPISDKLTFFLKSADNYPRAQQIEIANTDGSLHTKLGIADGTLILQNKHTVLATLEPLKVFGPSAFGPLHLRAIAPDGTTGDWIPLATIVRLPTLTDLHCPTRRPPGALHPRRLRPLSRRLLLQRPGLHLADRGSRRIRRHHCYHPASR